MKKLTIENLKSDEACEEWLAFVGPLIESDDPDINGRRVIGPVHPDDEEIDKQ